MGSNKKNDRMCVVCREMHQKAELFRIYRQADGSFGIDRTLRSGGRGAYVCRKPECIRSLTGKKVSNIMGGQLPREIVDELLTSIDNI